MGIEIGDDLHEAYIMIQVLQEVFYTASFFVPLNEYCHTHLANWEMDIQRTLHTSFRIPEMRKGRW